MQKKQNKKHFLITGITGFVGPHLAKLLLKNGHKVSGFIRGSNGRQMDLLDTLTSDEINNINWLYGDLKELETIKKIFDDNQFNGVFHLAAQSHPPTSFSHPLNTFRTNIMGSANLIAVIEESQKDCDLMFCSTSEVYGDTCRDKGILKENMPLAPINPYGVSKAAIDLYVQERCRNGFLRGFITRAFSHTGPRRGRNFSISCDAYYLALMKKGLIKKVLPVGNLKTKRIVVDVRDMVNAYYLLMQNHENGEAYNICGDTKDLKEMGFFTDKLIEISGLKDVKKKIDTRFYRPIDIHVQIADTTKLKRQVNWKPEIPIEKTLKDLFNYWTKKIQK